MATLQKQIADKFLAKLDESKDLDAEKIDQLGAPRFTERTVAEASSVTVRRAGVSNGLRGQVVTAATNRPKGIHMPILESKTLTISIDAAFQKVATDLADPTTHPDWAERFFSGPAVKTHGGEVLVPVPMMGGTARYKIEADIDRGILDLYLAREGTEFGAPIPVRLIKNGDGVDVLWTLTRFPGTPEAAWQGGLASMAEELRALKARHETSGPTAREQQS